MALRLVNIDRETPMLLPPSIQDWVDEDDMARFVVDAVNEVNLSSCKLNWRGSGSEQMPPKMMMALLIYCYAHGIFTSRKIERATYRDVAVRYIAGDKHPNFRVISDFRKDNGPLFKACFVKVLELAKTLKIRKVGEVALDGTILEANASKKKTLDYKELKRQERALEKQIEELIQKADESEAQEQQSGDGTCLPQELSHTQERRKALKEAMQRLEEQKRQRAEQRKKDRDDFDDQGPGNPPKPLAPKVKGEDRINLTDDQSQLMRAKKGGYVAGYNVQIAVQADPAAPLIIAASVTDETNDRRQLEPMAAQIMANQPETTRLLADTGYDNSGQIYKVEKAHGISVYCAPEEMTTKAKPSWRSKASRQTEEFRQKMRERMQSDFGKTCMRLRSTTVEPVFSWIKSTLGFTRFHLRGLKKVCLEWDLVCLAFDFKCLYWLKAARKTA